MNIFKFKTNINCGNCIQKVSKVMEKRNGVDQWEVDTTDPDKILTVQTDSLDADGVVKLVESVGFKATPA